MASHGPAQGGRSWPMMSSSLSLRSLLAQKEHDCVLWMKLKDRKMQEEDEEGNLHSPNSALSKWHQKGIRRYPQATGYILGEFLACFFHSQSSCLILPPAISLN